MNREFFSSGIGRWCLATMLVIAGLGPVQARDIGSFENVTAVQEQLVVNGRPRSVMMLKPTVPTTTERVPAILLLEYLRGTPVDMADLTEASALVRDFGVYVILPASSNGRWNYGATSFALTQDDVGFLTAVIDDAVRRFPIDARRIYMGGYSNGAQMTQRYICDQPSRIAAGAVISGSIHHDDRLRCAASVPTPMIIFHGTADEQINFNGNLLFSSSLQTAEHWASRAGCSLVPQNLGVIDGTDDGTSVQLNRYGNCSGGARVDHYIIAGGGHTWPGSLSFATPLGLTTQDVAATPTMWQFFRQFARP